MKEIAVVDLDDNTIGTSSKQEIHKKGILHSAFSIFLYHDDMVLLQCRADGKYHSGGLIANTCCSHKYIECDLFSCAKQRLKEEIGIEVDSFREVGSFVYFHKFKKNLYEYELDHVLVAKSNQEPIINKAEVKWAKWFPVEYIKKDLLQNPEKYSVWFFNAFNLFLRFIENNV